MNLRLPALLSSVALALFTPALRAEPIAVGADAPRLSATDQDAKTVDLGALYDHGLVLVYFYPKANTGGCTAQACSLRDAYEQLSSRGVTVVGVSTDTVADQKDFHGKFSLPFVLLADHEHKVVDAFGVPLFASGLATRQAFLIKNGKVVWRDLKASTAQQAADVLAALAQLAPAAG